MKFVATRLTCVIALPIIHRRTVTEASSNGVEKFIHVRNALEQLLTWL